MFHNPGSRNAGNRRTLLQGAHVPQNEQLAYKAGPAVLMSKNTNHTAHRLPPSSSLPPPVLSLVPPVPPVPNRARPPFLSLSSPPSCCRRHRTGALAAAASQAPPLASRRRALRLLARLRDRPTGPSRRRIRLRPQQPAERAERAERARSSAEAPRTLPPGRPRRRRPRALRATAPPSPQVEIPPTSRLRTRHSALPRLHALMRAGLLRALAAGRRPTNFPHRGSPRTRRWMEEPPPGGKRRCARAQHRGHHRSDSGRLARPPLPQTCPRAGLQPPVPAARAPHKRPPPRTGTLASRHRPRRLVRHPARRKRWDRRWQNRQSRLRPTSPA